MSDGQVPEMIYDLIVLALLLRRNTYSWARVLYSDDQMIVLRCWRDLRWQMAQCVVERRHTGRAAVDFFQSNLLDALSNTRKRRGQISSL